MNHQENWSHAVEGDPCWVSDPDEAFIEATFLSLNGDNVTVQTKAGKRIIVDAKAPLNPAARTKKTKGKVEEPRRLLLRSAGRTPNGVENMDDLSPLNSASVLSNIELRFRLDHIYTRTGPILIAMNPFKWLGIYGDEIIRQYHNKPYGSLPPHVFQEAEDAYQLMLYTNDNQAVIICGESGAGKTETTKLMLQYLSIVGRADDEPEDELSLGDQMVQSNPVMEAFGNSKTLRNNNSSRFGKFTIFTFDENGIISGGRISNFLLEKVRISSPSREERNYHIFYQLCAGATDMMRGQFRLQGPEYFRYLNNGCLLVDGVDDAEEFLCTVQSMNAVGVYEQEQMEIFRIVAGILHLGNVDFSSVTDGEGSRVKDMAQVNYASTLLGVDAASISQALITRVRQVPSGIVTSQQTATQSAETRDALAKAIYNKLFDWLVGRINMVLDSDTDPNDRFIGILDIFGFEDLNSNGFEQLFINYTNETLQKLFNEAMFKREEEEYRRENIDWNRTDFPDNDGCIELIEKKPLGLIPFMDSECTRGAAASDSSLVQKWHKAHKNHPFYGACGPATQYRRKNGSMTDETEFVIKHYAGPVLYVCEGFIEKNRDSLFDHVADVAAGSQSDLMRVLFPPQETRGGRSMQETVAGRFQAQLVALTQTLQVCNSRFIRCIKSNHLLQPQVIDKPSVLNQLVCSGVMSALEVRRAGYPTRVMYEDFVRQFKVLLQYKSSPNLTLHRTFSQIQLARLDEHPDDISAKEQTARMMTHPAVLQDITARQYRLGKTKLFLQSDVLNILENLRNRILLPFVYRLQRWWLKQNHNILAHKLKRAVSHLAEAISLAEVCGVQNITYVRESCEDAMAAVRYAKAIGLFNNDVFRPALATAVDKVRIARESVNKAKAAKEQEAQQRAELLQILDSGRARVSRIRDGSSGLFFKSEELDKTLKNASASIDRCRVSLLRAANREAFSRSENTQAQNASVEIRRTFTKAVLQLEETESEEDFAYIDLDERRERVTQAVALVDRAEAIYQSLLAEQLMLDQARNAYQASLDASFQSYEKLMEKAEEAGIASMVVVENALCNAEETIKVAREALVENSVEHFELYTRQAAEAVDDAHQVLMREQANKVQEDRRIAGRKRVDSAARKLRSISTDADVGGISNYPAVLEALAAAEEAINHASMLELADARDFMDAAEIAAQKIDEFEKLCAKEKHRKERNDRERFGEIQRLQPSIDSLAELQAKIEVGGLTADSSVYSAIMEAAKLMDSTRSLLEVTDDVAGCRPRVQETIMKVVLAERAFAEEKQRRDALQRETSLAQKDLEAVEKRLHALQQIAESAGTAIAQVVESVIKDAEHAVVETKRTLRKGEAVGTVRSAVANAEAKIDRAEDYVARQKQIAIQSQKIRANEAADLEAAVQTFVQAVEAMEQANIEDIPEIREAVLAAESSIRMARSRLSKPLTAAWLTHNELARDQNAVREAVEKVGTAEDKILAMTMNLEGSEREIRITQDNLDLAFDKLEALTNLIAEHGLGNDAAVMNAMEESEDAFQDAKKQLRHEGRVSVEHSRAAVENLMQKLQNAEDTTMQARLTKDTSEKEKIAAQNQLDVIITKLQGVVAMVSAAGPAVAAITEDFLDEATESVNVATRLLRRGNDVEGFASAVASASAVVDQAEEHAMKMKQRIAKATKQRASALSRLESLSETVAVAQEKAVALGLRNLHTINNALSMAESVLQMARRRAEGGTDTWIEDGVTISRLVDEAAEKVQIAEETVDEASFRKDRQNKERREALAELESLTERHLAVVDEVDKANLPNVLSMQQAIMAAERELESVRQSLQAGTSGHSLNAATDRVREEEELVHLEKHKREKREVEMQRAERELPILQRRIAAVTAKVEAAGPIVGMLVEPELSQSQKAVRDLERFMEFGDKFVMVWPTVENAEKKVSSTEEVAQRQINRVFKVHKKKREELQRLDALQNRFSEIGEIVASFCTRSDHLRLQLNADWKDVCWWGSQVKHTYADGSPIGRGEIKPMSSVQLITEVVTAAESAIITARKRAEVSIEEWLEIGPGAVHKVIEDASNKVEAAFELVERETTKLEQEEKERSSAREKLDNLLDRIASIRATVELGGVFDLPVVSDALRGAEHAVDVVANLLTAGHVHASPPAMEVANKKVSDAQEVALLEVQRRERITAERVHLKNVLAEATTKFESTKETAEFLMITKAALVQDSLTRAAKSISGADLVLKSEFGLTIVSKEVQLACQAVEEAERCVKREKARREEMAGLNSRREMQSRARKLRELEEKRRRAEEETRHRRRMQDELDRAVHSLKVQSPVVEEVQALMGMAESAVEAARDKLSSGGLAAATAAVQSAILKVNDVEAAAHTANLWEDAHYRPNVFDPLDPSTMKYVPEMGAETGLPPNAPQNYLESANEYMGRTTTAFEAMTANMHFLTQGLMNVNRMMQHQARVMALQTNLLSGSGDHETQIRELSQLQQAGAMLAETTSMSVRPPATVQRPVVPPSAQALMKEHARKQQRLARQAPESSPTRFNPSSTSNSDFDEGSEATEEAAENATAQPVNQGGVDDQNTQDSNPLSLGYPNFPMDCSSLLSRFLTRPIFNQLKNLSTSSGVKLQDCIISGVEHLDSPVGVYACDSESIVLFAALFEPIIMELHPLYSPDTQHPVDQESSKLSITAMDADSWLNTSISISRNLTGYNLLPKVSREQLLQIETILRDALLSLQGEFSGDYFSMEAIEADAALKSDLQQKGLVFSASDRVKEAAGLYDYWSQGRGVFVAHNMSVAVWVNEEDHLRAMSTHSRPETAFHNTISVIKQLEQTMEFDFNAQVGYVTASLEKLGTAMDVTLRMRVSQPVPVELLQRIQDTDGVVGESEEEDPSVLCLMNELTIGVTEVQTLLSVVSASMTVARALQETD